MKETKNLLLGQWYGYFSYGPEYGDKLLRERVIFSFLIEVVTNNKFKGKCIELEGTGASTEVSSIEGFVESNFISFQKTYKTYHSIDENGNVQKSDHKMEPQISYSGQFDEVTQIFSGSWEICSNQRLVNNGIRVDIATGNWEISKDHNKYGV